MSLKREVRRYTRRIVSRGAKLLDNKHPGWHERVNKRRLKLSNCQECVLGQVFREKYGHGAFDRAHEELGYRFSEHINYGFVLSYRKLRDLRARYGTAEEIEYDSGITRYAWKCLEEAWLRQIELRSTSGDGHSEEATVTVNNERQDILA